MTELKHAFRQLLLRPGLSATVIVMLALGLGATTAIFSLFYEILLQPLPVPEPDRLVSLTVPGPKPGGGRSGLAFSDFDASFSYPMFRDLEAKQQPFTGLAGHYDVFVNLGSGEHAMFGNGTLVSGQYFDVLGVRPALGRLIGPQDEPAVGESSVVVLTYDYWQRQFGGDPGVLDKTLLVNGHNLTIVGVAPEGFIGAMPGWNTHVFVPLTLRWLMQPEEVRADENRFSYWLHILARLKPGVSVTQATAAMNVLFAGITREVEASMLPAQVTAVQRERFVERRMVLEPGARGQSNVPAQQTTPLTLLLGITALLLLIVCVNIANLLLARGTARAGELAIRTSVGASRGRLAAQLLAEAAVLGLLGALASAPVAVVTLRLVSVIAPSSIPVSLQLPALAFAGAATLATVLLFGLAPAIQASRTSLNSVIKGQAAQSRGGRGVARFNSVLITAQIAFATILLVLAGLFTRSLLNVARLDLGMNVDSVASFSLSPLLSGYRRDQLDAIYERVRTELAAQPGIHSVASQALPILGSYQFGVSVESVNGAEQPANTFADNSPMVSPQFFESLSIPFVSGRDFTDADRTGPPVAIVNEAAVKKFGLGNAAVGAHVRLGRSFAVPGGDTEIVGVVRDARVANVKHDPQPQFYTPRPRGNTAFGSMFYLVRGEIGADALLTMIPRVVARIDPNLPVGSLTTVKRAADGNVSQDRVVTTLSTTLAGLATLLAAIGLYGVLAYSVAQRTRELGLRLALGASPTALRKMVLKQVGVVALVGAALGLVAALAVSHVIGSMLYGLSSFDPESLGAAVAILVLVTLGAAYVPARRASSIAPLEALRYE